jgi:hypothetical protein
MIHYLTVGHLNPDALRGCTAVATTPLDETTVGIVLAEFPGIIAERKDGYVVLPWHGLGPVDVSEAFALRLHELTGCLIADRRNGRIIEPEALARKKRAKVQGVREEKTCTASSAGEEKEEKTCTASSAASQ